MVTFLDTNFEKKLERDYLLGIRHIYISDCIPKNVPADLTTSIHVTGDFFLRERGGKGGGGGGEGIS